LITDRPIRTVESSSIGSSDMSGARSGIKELFRELSSSDDFFSPKKYFQQNSSTNS